MIKKKEDALKFITFGIFFQIYEHNLFLLKMSPHPRPQSNYIDDPGGLEDPTPLLQETTNPLFGPLSYQNDRDGLGGSDLTSPADPSRQNFITKMSTEFFALPGLPPLPSGRPGSIDDLVGSGEGRGPRQMCPDWGSTKCLEDLVTNKTLVTSPGGGHGGLGSEAGGGGGGYGGLLTRESWMVPMLALASVNVVVILAFEVFVLCKASRNTPSRRHLFLGQMLLLGLLMGSVVGFAYAIEPTDLSCAVIRLGTGFAYTLIYSSLLVKLVFLISLNTGVYLPATYQALLFLFCILVQFVIGVQWLSSSGPLCHFSTEEHLLSLLYVIFLILFACSLAVKSRRYGDNYREAKYIGIVMAVSVPIWLAWTVASVVLNESFHPPIVGKKNLTKGWVSGP